SKDPDVDTWPADPEGAAQDVRRFSTRQGCLVEKSPRRRIPGFAVGTKAFSLVRFFDAYQRNELGRAAGETLLIFCLSGIRTQSRQVQKSEAFAFGDFISFDERQKKRKQRKTLCAQGKPGCSLMKGFF